MLKQTNAINSLILINLKNVNIAKSVNKEVCNK